MVHADLVQALVTFAVALGLFAWVASRRERSTVHGHLLALLAAAGVWAGGLLGQLLAPPAWQWGVVLVTWIGVLAVPTLWLLLAARYARVHVIERLSTASAVVFAPMVFFFGVIVTNDHHDLFLPALSWREVQAGAIDEAGPLFWVFMAVDYLYVLAGIALYLFKARSAGKLDLQRALLLAAAALVPLGASALFVFGLVDDDPTPGSLGVSAIFIFTALLRFSFLEALPLARRDVIDHLPEGVLIADADGLILDVNAAAEHILTMPVAAVHGRRLAQVIGQLGSEEQADDLERALAVHSPSGPPLMMELHSQDDRRIELTAARVRGRSGEPAGQFALLRDRTSERRYERFVRQTQKLESVGVLAAGIAHEVNNPLAYVRSNLLQLQRLGTMVDKYLPHYRETGPDPDLGISTSELDELAELGQVVDEILDGVDRIGRITNGMRRFSRISRETREPVDVNEVVQEAIRLAELHENRSVGVEPRLAPGLPTVQGSAERLTQVVLNLLLNAKQALADWPHGCIHAETVRTGPDLEVRIRDNGPGVPLEIQDRVFDPFFTTKGPTEGTGLGLAIAFDIVREHGGALELRSRAGEGACFVVRFPLARPD